LFLRAARRAAGALRRQSCAKATRHSPETIPVLPFDVHQSGSLAPNLHFAGLLLSRSDNRQQPKGARVGQEAEAGAGRGNRSGFPPAIILRRTCSLRDRRSVPGQRIKDYASFECLTAFRACGALV